MIRIPRAGRHRQAPEPPDGGGAGFWLGGQQVAARCSASRLRHLCAKALQNGGSWKGFRRGPGQGEPSPLV